MLGAGILGLTLPIAALAATPAGATVHVGAINCDAHAVLLPSTVLGDVAVQNPSTSRVDAPTWSAQGGAFTFTVAAALQILPSSAGGQNVDHFSDLNTTDQIIGQNVPPSSQGAGDTTITTAADAPIPGYFWDNDVTDNTPPVPMDGVGTHPPAPHGSIDQGPVLLASGGVYYLHNSIAPSGSFPAGLHPAGAVGGGIFSPATVVNVTNAGAQDGPINFIGASTQLTAFVLGGAISATTSCAPSAAPEATVHVHTAGSPPRASEPVVACDPATAPTGFVSVSKGFWSGPAGTGDPAAQAADSLKASTTYDGCVVPDQQADQWNGSKHGAPAAVALTATKALISLKGAGFGDCKQVSIRNAAGENEQGYPNTYQIAGSLSTKYENGGGVVVKVPGTAAAVVIKLEIDKNNNPIAQPIPDVTVEADGTVTKGLGVGGAVQFITTLDKTSADVAAILGCNGVAGQATINNQFIGAIKPGLPIVAGNEDIFQVSRP
jgi:hypothetical protein